MQSTQRQRTNIRHLHYFFKKEESLRQSAECETQRQHSKNGNRVSYNTWIFVFPSFPTTAWFLSETIGCSKWQRLYTWYICEGGELA